MNLANDKRKLAFAKSPGLIRDALRDFRKLTGFTAVTALCPMSVAGPTRQIPLPPVHPRCAKLLRKLPYRPPCEAQWRHHLRVARKTLSCLRHTCPLGLHCACVPIILGDELLGLAKFVSGPELPDGRFHATVDLLELLISRPCQALHVYLLREENQVLRTSLNRLRRAKQPASLGGDGIHPNGCANQTHRASPQVQTLISQVLDYLYEHFPKNVHPPCPFSVPEFRITEWTNENRDAYEPRMLKEALVEAARFPSPPSVSANASGPRRQQQRHLANRADFRQVRPGASFWFG